MEIRALGLGLVVLGLACTPLREAQGEAASESTGPATATTSTSASVTASGSTTIDEPPDQGETNGGASFISDVDSELECDHFAQDCPRGEKCMPWASDGLWFNATRCVPVDPNPVGLGETCWAEGNGLRGIDNCDFAMQCWDVDPDTGEGTCVAICGGSEAAPTCPEWSSGCSIASNPVPALCFPRCRPLEQDCPEGEACILYGDDLACTPDVSAPGTIAGDPCEFANACPPGTTCVDADQFESCAGPACCTAFCDVDDAAPPCLPGQTCLAIFAAGESPEGFESVGLCGVPP